MFRSENPVTTQKRQAFEVVQKELLSGDKMGIFDKLRGSKRDPNLVDEFF